MNNSNKINRCYIGLGSNLHNPLKQLNDAKDKIANLPDTRLLQFSSIYQSKALTLDNEPQNDYLNAVIEIDTSLEAENLLNVLQQIELQQGRVRGKRWAARTLDLDILLYGNQQIKTERLIVPHIEIENRNFVMIPLSQIAAGIEIPGKGKLKKLIESLNDQVLDKMGEFDGKA
ncbi:MAG: 2-amino-4-hydroxy-6-hydroxymethyldihydropteridine diphosphokinase [Gammaproteobacteria bacterium]|nr:2-amino-4-hydroxy-6-hydroxymethyldihydropteridine diphosphokinase [Gammaproteobacteria bacterium]